MLPGACVRDSRSRGRLHNGAKDAYFNTPVVSQKNAARYGDLVTMGLEPDETVSAAANASLQYPLREVRSAPGGRPNIVLLLLESWRYDMMDATVTPNTWALAQRSSQFLHHLSSGNSTPCGVFGLFYGIHPTYWSAVKANNAVQQIPEIPKLVDTSFTQYAVQRLGPYQ